jgi:hypothetical protein
MTRLTNSERDALALLFSTTMYDTEQAKRCADFLLAWHNAAENGGWNPADLWAVDAPLEAAMLIVLGAIAREHAYPSELSYDRQIKAVCERWRQTPPTV